MDYFTRAYMRKANLKIKDDFHEQLTLGDIDHLRWARFYLIITPLTFLGAVHFMNKMRESGGFSKHFRNMFQRARSSYASKNEATWERASQGYKEKKTDASGKPEPVKDIYKDVIKERQQIQKSETESKIVVPVAKRQVRNTDPFERKRRLAMGIKTHATSPQDAEQFTAAKILSAAEARRVQVEKQSQPLTAGQYFDASSKQYHDEHEFKSGSLYRQQIGEVETQNNFAKKQISFMKSLRFGFIKERFLRMRSSP